MLADKCTCFHMFSIFHLLKGFLWANLLICRSNLCNNMRELCAAPAMVNPRMHQGLCHPHIVGLYEVSRLEVGNLGELLVISSAAQLSESGHQQMSSSTGANINREPSVTTCDPADAMVKFSRDSSHSPRFFKMMMWCRWSWSAAMVETSSISFHLTHHRVVSQNSVLSGFRWGHGWRVGIQEKHLHLHVPMQHMHMHDDTFCITDVYWHEWTSTYETQWIPMDICWYDV